MSTENTSRRLEDGSLDNGDYEVASQPVVYFNDGSEGTGVPEISAPTIVILFEHDDVTGLSSTPYGTVEVSHYYGGCRTEIQTDPFSSAIGEFILDPSRNFDNDFTGLGRRRYNQELRNAVHTIIRYPMASLDADTEITEELSGVVTTKFCVRLSLLNERGAEFGFREQDVTITHTKDSYVDLRLGTQEEVTDDFDGSIGDYSVSAIFCNSDSFPVVRTERPDARSPLVQGEDFSICLGPIDTDGDYTNVMEIVSVDNCDFWIDTNPNGLIDSEEVSLEVIADGDIVDSAVNDMVCDPGMFVNRRGDGGLDRDQEYAGCTFTTTLPPQFFDEEREIVVGRCVVTLEFHGIESSSPGGLDRRVLQLAVGETGQVATPLLIEVQGSEAEDDESCTAGCFLLFCWIRFIWCFLISLFGSS